MPEGDSVFRAAAALHRALAERVVVRGELRWPTLAGAVLAGDTTIEVVARGKHILHRLASGRTLHSHLKMEGSWRVSTAPTGPDPGAWSSGWVRALLVTEGSAAVGWRLGQLDLVRTAEELRLVGHLGPDILGSDWDEARAFRNVRGYGEGLVAAALLDQRNLAGLGTVYVSESLFLQGVSPWASVSSLSDRNLAALVARAVRLLRANRDDPRRTTTGSRVSGHESYVHGRARRPCRRCGTTIQVRPLDPAAAAGAHADRVMFFCPRCQSVPLRD